MSSPRSPSRAALAFLALSWVSCCVTPTTLAQHVDRPRIRFGLSGLGGGLVGVIHGAVGGISPSVGLQVNDSFAVYVHGQFLLGQFLPEPTEGLVGFAFSAIMFELTASGFVQFGLGPSLDFVFGCDEVLQRECAGSGPRFGGDARLAFLVGGREEDRPSSLALSLDVHPTWLGGDAAIAVLAGIGYERR